MPPQPAPPASLGLPEDILEAMVDHCLREKPLECCGLLGGVSPAVSSIHPLRNLDSSPTHYNADPRDLIDAVVWLREHGAEILAIYHSHPHHAAVPSATDLRENYYGDVPRIIVGLAKVQPEVRMWRLWSESYEELQWHTLPRLQAGAVEGPAEGG